MTTSSWYHSVPERIGHVAANCGGNVVVYGGYFSRDEFRDEYHRADRVLVYNVQTALWQSTTLSASRQQMEKQRSAKTHLPPPPLTAAVAVADVEDVAGGLMRLSGACGVQQPDGNALYVYGGHSASGKAACLMRIDLRSFTYDRLTDGPAAVDKLAGWFWNDRLYFFGGYGMRPEAGSTCDYILDMHSMYGYMWLNELMSYDLILGTWKYERVKGTPPSPRAAHTAAIIGTMAFIFGGRRDDVRLNDLHCLDLASMSWSGRLKVKGEEQVCGRSWHTFTAVGANHILLYGGFSTDEEVLGDIWLLDVAALAWTRLDRGPDFERPSLWHTATHCPTNGDTVVFGGCSHNLLNQRPSADDFERAGSCPRRLRLSPDSLYRISLRKVYSLKAYTPVRTMSTEPASTLLPAAIQNELCRQERLRSAALDELPLAELMASN